MADEAAEDQFADLSVPDERLGFLAAHDDRAFKTHEIASQTDIDEGAVSTALSRLKDRGMVAHETTYWAVTDDTERIEGHSGHERVTALFDDRLGAEEADAWHDHGPSESHPTVDDETDEGTGPVFEREDVADSEGLIAGGARARSSPGPVAESGANDP